MNNYIQITFFDLQSEVQELLIAHLAEAGYEGFEQNENELKAFISEAPFNEKEVNTIADSYNLSFTKSLIRETNWNQLWESNFQPVIVDDFVAVRAAFHSPVKGVEHEIVITPKMSFGTGHHATTYMMMQQMRHISFKNKYVADFGTGTGVLAILAEKLGAAGITAIDNDEWSIRNAAENISENKCRLIQLIHTDSLDSRENFDIILANINKNVITAHFSSLIERLTANGILLLSGLLINDRSVILELANQQNVAITSELTQGEWLCLSIQG